MTAQPRSPYWDTWKGFSILAVIGTHACDTALVFPTGSLTFRWAITVQQFLAFSVSVFLALSGYLSASRPPSFTEAKRFWRKRFARLLPPYLVWTAIAILVSNPRHFLEPLRLLWDVLSGSGMGIGYFVIVLFQFVLLTPLILRIRKDAVHFLVMATLTLASHALFYWLRLRHPDYALSRFPGYALPFWIWYPFYHLGIWIRRKQMDRPDFLIGKARFIFPLYLLCVTASIGECAFLVKHGLAGMGPSQLKVTTLFASICLVLMIFSLRNHEKLGGRGFAWLGKHSYPIYMSHFLVLGKIHSLLPAEGFPLFVVVLAAATLATCIAGIALAKRWIPDRARTTWLGI